ncbi:MAG: histidine kinase dimerization/phospho-acceptor domain-containing protein [Myxococcota bacterium]
MASLALISTDSELRARVHAALRETSWSIVAPEIIDGEPRLESDAADVIAVDAADWNPRAAHFPRGVPVLWVVDEATATPAADPIGHDLIFRQAGPIEWATRVERLQARTPLLTMPFLESLIDASVDAIIATDMDQRVILFNPSAEQITGRHLSDATAELNLEGLLGRASAELVMQRLVAEGYGGQGRLEPTLLELVNAHGAQIPVQLSASLIYENDQPSAIVLIFTDLRERVRMEERLAEAQKRLAFTDKRGVLAELAGTAAHELNQPLTSMMAYAELLLRQSEPGSTGAKAAQVLIREAERMAEIVRKIGKITKYETTSYVGHQKIFDLDRAADSSSSEPGPER